MVMYVAVSVMVCYRVGKWREMFISAAVSVMVFY